MRSASEKSGTGRRMVIDARGMGKRGRRRTCLHASTGDIISTFFSIQFIDRSFWLCDASTEMWVAFGWIRKVGRVHDDAENAQHRKFGGKFRYRGGMQGCYTIYLEILPKWHCHRMF